MHEWLAHAPGMESVMNPGLNPGLLAMIAVMSIGLICAILADASLVFDRRLLQHLKRFSIKTVLIGSAYCAIAFAITRATELSLVASAFIAGFAVSLLYLIAVAMRDVSEPYAKRRYAKKLRMSRSSRRSSHSEMRSELAKIGDQADGPRTRP